MLVYDCKLLHKNFWNICILVLLQCHLSYRENEGRTPLWCACSKGHCKVVKLLQKEGAKVELQDLQAAIEEGNE